MVFNTEYSKTASLIIMEVNLLSQMQKVVLRFKI